MYQNEWFNNLIIKHINSMFMYNCLFELWYDINVTFKFVMFVIVAKKLKFKFIEIPLKKPLIKAKQ